MELYQGKHNRKASPLKHHHHLVEYSLSPHLLSAGREPTNVYYSNSPSRDRGFNCYFFNSHYKYFSSSCCSFPLPSPPNISCLVMYVFPMRCKQFLVRLAQLEWKTGCGWSWIEKCFLTLWLLKSFNNLCSAAAERKQRMGKSSGPSAVDNIPLIVGEN